MRRSRVHLADFRLPGYLDAPLLCNGRPLSIFPEDFTKSDLEKREHSPHDTSTSDSAISVGISTILYRWNSNALAAFLDSDAWFSLTWSVATPDDKKFEIGRIGNQITFGTLDSSGENWNVMLTYNIIPTGELSSFWVPNLKECMLGERDIEQFEDAERLAVEWVANAISKKIWETGKGIKHGFWVEYAPMDIFGDGLPMSPHWLYASPDLDSCANCSSQQSLNRCGKCGTAVYCSSACQKSDWKVHKWICTMSLEDRGQTLKITEKGGLLGWDKTKTMVGSGEEVQSENPNFAEPQLKRQRE